MRAQLQPCMRPNWQESPTPILRPTSAHRETKASAWPGDYPQWMDASELVATFMEKHGRDIEPGWRELAASTLVKLLSAVVGSPQRSRALAGMRVCSTATELCFSVSSHNRKPDHVIDGIFRKTRCTSRTLCKQCGCPARVREIGEEACTTLCAKCSAPHLLLHDIWDLGQSVRFLKAVGRPVSMSQIPLLLRPSFMQTANIREEDAAADKVAQMTPACFVRWAAEWEEIGETLELLH